MHTEYRKCVFIYSIMIYFDTMQNVLCAARHVFSTVHGTCASGEVTVTIVHPWN